MKSNFPECDILCRGGIPIRYVIRVLGCKVNQYEAGQVEHLLRLKGFSPADKGERADLVVVHGCAVTNPAARKSRQALHVLREEHPDSLIIMSGCGAAVPGFDAASEHCLAVVPGENWLSNLETAIHEHFGIHPERKAAQASGLDYFSGHKRAFLKIQDGCSIGCTYCIVPRLRGSSRDKPPAEILHEAETLAAHGYREIVVAGVSVGLYGAQSGVTLPDVLRALLQIPGIERLRMSSLHPQEVSSGLLEVWSSTPRMMPHVHLPLQSGSNTILAAMRRGYTAESFLAAVERFRRALPRPAFTTDVITGFPGETEADFQATLFVAEQAGFSGVHVFPYSDRPGTVAGRLSGKVPAPVARERAARLQQLADRLAAQYFESLIGCEERVFVEQYADGRCTGHGERYFPITFPGTSDWLRHTVAVRLTGVSGNGMTGVPSASRSGNGPC